MSRPDLGVSNLISSLSSSERLKVNLTQLLELCQEWDSSKLELKEALESLSQGETRKVSIDCETENDYWDSKWTITNSVGKNK
jgi:hypothetical protein